jgi:hypothetical protein
MPAEQLETDGGHSKDVERNQDYSHHGEPVEASQQGVYGCGSQYGGDHNEITSASRRFLL